MSGRNRPSAACVEDADDAGTVFEGTARYATSCAPGSPIKQQPNTGRVRREKGRKSDGSPLNGHTDSDSTLPRRERDSTKKPSTHRDKSASASSKKALMTSRPALKPTRTAPPESRGYSRKSMDTHDAQYFGVNEPAPPPPAPATRPRSKTTRPTSYYGSSPSRPPLTHQNRYYSQTPGPSMNSGFAPPPPLANAPQWSGPPPGPPPLGPMSAPMQIPYPPPGSSPVVMNGPGPGPEYFPPRGESFSRPLESRFGSYNRPQSAMGYRPQQPPAIEYGNDWEEPQVPTSKQLARRPSTNRRLSKVDSDKGIMPPPPRRPQSARPVPSSGFAPPAPSTPISRRNVYDDLERTDDDLFNLSPMNADYGAGHSTNLAHRPKPSRMSSGLADEAYNDYEYNPMPVEPYGKHMRRSSYFGDSASGSAYEDQVRSATRYQEELMGSSPLPLTAETLAKARNGGSSRSSGSRDESDYRQSYTTRTTHTTAPHDEDFTIRVKGNTTLKIGGAEMECHDGAEINITKNGASLGYRGGGSDASYGDHDDRHTRVDLDDRRTRVDFPVRPRTRGASRARSIPRIPNYPAYPDAASPEYEYVGADDYAPSIPPYPQYPGTYSSSRPDDHYFDSRR
ncbi:hypothetical protein QBC40DRAFT_32187 [Triangularia verruculosa]|uniref:Uncharacterized protein n=1 Tax=Triangularia verruculosa TaxID=2587418 RepID=A0AAN6XLP4_9PEZI|nr:hypothetical protein QBC40DRAFT_32187 [Triangularia verruculosa]